MCLMGEDYVGMMAFFSSLFAEPCVDEHHSFCPARLHVDWRISLLSVFVGFWMVSKFCLLEVIDLLDK